MRAQEIFEDQEAGHFDLKVPDGVWTLEVKPQGYLGISISYRDPHPTYVLRSDQNPLGVMVDMTDHQNVLHHTPLENYSAEFLNRNLLPLVHKLHWRFKLTHNLMQAQDGHFIDVPLEHPPQVVLKDIDHYHHTWYKLSWNDYQEYYMAPGVIPSTFWNPSHDVYFKMINTVEHGARIYGRHIARDLAVVDGNRLLWCNVRHKEALSKLSQHLQLADTKPSADISEYHIYLRNHVACPTTDFLTQNKIGELSNGDDIYDAPLDIPGVIQATFGKTYATATRLLVVKTWIHRVERFFIFAIRNGKIMGKATNWQVPTGTLDKVAKELAAMPELGLAKPSSKMIKPNGAVHRALKYIAANPGVNRSAVYVQGLGRSGHQMMIPRITDIASPDGFLVAAKLIDYDQDARGAYSFKALPLSKFILALLDKGKSVPVDSLIKS